MNKLKLRKIKKLVQGHMASIGWSQKSNRGSSSHGLSFSLHHDTFQNKGLALLSEATEVR